MMSKVANQAKGGQLIVASLEPKAANLAKGVQLLVAAFETLASFGVFARGFHQGIAVLSAGGQVGQ